MEHTTPTAAMLAASHPDAAKALVGMGLTCRDAELEKNIGRVVKFKDWTPQFGTIARDYLFEIVGVQKNWRGEHCYRVQAPAAGDTFGRPANPREVELLPAAITEGNTRAWKHGDRAGDATSIGLPADLAAWPATLPSTIGTGADFIHDTSSPDEMDLRVYYQPESCIEITIYNDHPGQQWAKGDDTTAAA